MKNMKKGVIKFSKTRNVNLPSRSYKSDAGIDFYVPKFDKEFVEDLKEKNEKYFNDVPLYITGTLSHGLCGTTITTSGQITCDNDTPEPKSDFFFFDENKGKTYLELKPNMGINIPSGIHCNMDGENKALIAFNKSGIASKHSLLVGACVVDKSYQGEIHINVINAGKKTVRIYEDQKLVQFVEMPIIISDIVEQPLDALYEKTSDRASGGFGSTDSE